MDEKKYNWLWDFSLFLPKNSVRAIAFLGTLFYLCYLASHVKGDLKNMIVGGLVSLVTTAAHLYFEGREKEK